MGDNKLYLKPAEGLVIPNPDTGLDLPKHGAAVTNSAYWRRLLRSKDVVATTAEQIAAAEETPAAKKGK